MNYQLLDSFVGLFEGNLYRHRNSSQGDAVALRLFEDIYDLGQSPKFNQRVDTGRAVLNLRNNRRGIMARRGDGTFGEIVPGSEVDHAQGFRVGRGETATIEIGVEVKVLAKAMIKQIDRVVSDLSKQVVHFKSSGGNPLTVGVVGINYAKNYCSLEGERAWPTDGKRYKHPIQEAAQAEARLRALAAPNFDEMIFLRYVATNYDPFDFAWVNKRATEMDYGAVLARISASYERRMP